MIKYFKPSIFVLSTIPFLVITYKIFFNKLGKTIEIKNEKISKNF